MVKFSFMTGATQKATRSQKMSAHPSTQVRVSCFILKQGCHGTWRTGNLDVHFSRQGKNAQKNKRKTRNVPLVYVPTAWKPDMLQFQFNGHHQTSLPEEGDPQMNKFEQVSSVCHQMSLTGESPGKMSGGGVPYLTFPRGKGYPT